MRLALAACAALLCASCVKRIAPSAGGGRTLRSGVPKRFGTAQALPGGTSVSWDLGDGTPQQSGPEAIHAFPRAGNFTVTETVREAGGTVRTDSARVTVLRRSVPMAVPADVRGVFLAQQPWTRAKAARTAARRIGLGDFFDETVGAVNDAVGFDTTDAQAVAENGIDPDEGVALYTVPQDPEALVLCIGISDLPRAEAALRKLLTAGVEPFALTEAKLPGGGRAVVGTAAQGTLRVGYLERFGYLYLRARGGTDPLLALASAAAVPEAGGLERDRSYQTALKQVGAGDALFYSAASREGAGEDRRSFLSGQLGASAFSVGLGKDGLQLRLFGQLRNLNAQGLQELLTPLKPPPDLAAPLPGGAAAYFKLSGEPQRTWTELLRALGPDAAQVRDRAREFLGAEPEASFLPLFTATPGSASTWTRPRCWRPSSASRCPRWTSRRSSPPPRCARARTRSCERSSTSWAAAGSRRSRCAARRCGSCPRSFKWRSGPAGSTWRWVAGHSTRSRLLPQSIVRRLPPGRRSRRRRAPSPRGSRLPRSSARWPRGRSPIPPRGRSGRSWPLRASAASRCRTARSPGSTSRACCARWSARPTIRAGWCRLACTCSPPPCAAFATPSSRHAPRPTAWERR